MRSIVVPFVRSKIVWIEVVMVTSCFVSMCLKGGGYFARQRLGTVDVLTLTSSHQNWYSVAFVENFSAVFDATTIFLACIRLLPHLIVCVSSIQLID